MSPSAPDGGLLTWRNRRLRLVTVVVLALALVAGYLMTQVLPTAEITLVPRVATIGPLEVAVVASVETNEVDASSGTIPATVLAIPLEASDTYEASGTETIETAAAGTVVFSALDQDFDQEIAAGTRVSTPAGIAFQTTESVTLPRSEGTSTTVEAPVEALEPGKDGDVPAEAISLVPSLESQGIAVTNLQPTLGGRIETTPLATAADYDAAAVDLRNRLTSELAVYLRDPEDAPSGSTVFPGTAVLGPMALAPPAEEIVGREMADFELSGAADASVLAVDESAVDDVLRARVLAAVPPGLALLDETVVVGRGEGSVDGSVVTFLGTASGRAVTVVDRELLLDRIAGLPIPEAQAILEGLGAATVNAWPGFMGDLPNDRQRITLDVDEAPATE